MLAPAIFGISNSGVNLAIDLLILFLVVIWLALVYWTYADARRRIADPMLIACATAASLFPFVGTLVYMIVRPPEYLEDVRERELEIQAAEARLHQLEVSLCPHCDYHVEKDFIRCPSCLRKLKERCTNCSRPLDQAWTICPYCETDVPSLAPKRTRRSAAGRPRRAGGTLEAELPELDSAIAAAEDPAATAVTDSGEPAVAAEPTPRPRTPAGRARRPRTTS